MFFLWFSDFNSALCRCMTEVLSWRWRSSSVKPVFLEIRQWIKAKFCGKVHVPIPQVFYVAVVVFKSFYIYLFVFFLIVNMGPHSSIRMCLSSNSIFWQYIPKQRTHRSSLMLLRKISTKVLKELCNFRQVQRMSPIQPWALQGKRYPI